MISMIEDSLALRYHRVLLQGPLKGYLEGFPVRVTMRVL